MGNANRTPLYHALALAALGAWLTFAFTNPLGQAWAFKDYIFVGAVGVAVYYNRKSTIKYEQLIQQDHSQRRRTVPPLRRIEWVHGPAVEIAVNKITVLLFFGTWCKDSRAALQVLERLRRRFTHGAVQFVALTQEKREELAAYEVKGRGASDFQELKEFTFSIAIEDGLMSKGYLVRFDLFHIPQLFIVGKDMTIEWYGPPTDKGIEGRIRSCLGEENVPVDAPPHDDSSSSSSVETKKDK